MPGSAMTRAPFPTGSDDSTVASVSNGVLLKGSFLILSSSVDTSPTKWLRAES